ncbi:transposase [Croceicoccus hydrothermalis]|uniref:transposase n=1 Tax=Croceicoccus hydrothermalis TaxID=2867964 RepID=UPI003B839E4B
MGQITVFSGPERRRRWSEEERLRILTEAFSPGASVTDVARRLDGADLYLAPQASRSERRTDAGGIA